MKRKISFVTFGDSGFFPFIKTNLKAINQLYPESKIFICNFGFEKEELGALKNFNNVEIINWNEREELRKFFHSKRRSFFDELFKLKKYNKIFRILLNRLFISEGTYRAIFQHFLLSKPIILPKIISRINNDYLVLLDGDALLTDNINEIFKNSFEIGVTADNGKKVNAGVLFFKCSDKRKLIFSSEWIGKTLIELQNNPLIPWGIIPEQDALEKMAFGPYPNKENILYKEFPRSIYNYTTPEKGIKGKKIIHYKGVGSRKEAPPYLEEIKRKFKKVN
ncbi:MAG: hypothetical protein WDZ69_00025 [Candidatus Pacearchaeota archaeon]